MAMGSPLGAESGELAKPAVREAERPSHRGRPTPGTILVVSAWIGLVSGFLDLGMVILRKHLIDGEFYRLGHGFPWIIPVAVAAMVVLPGAALALVARLRRRGMPLAVVVGLSAFLGFLT